MLDFVPNHTSNESDWFIKSANKDEYYSDWYIWENGHLDERGGRSPPNNWVKKYKCLNLIFWMLTFEMIYLLVRLEIRNKKWHIFYMIFTAKRGRHFQLFKYRSTNITYQQNIGVLMDLLSIMLRVFFKYS